MVNNKLFYLFPWLLFLWPALSIFSELPYSVDANYYGWHAVAIAVLSLWFSLFNWLILKLGDWAKNLIFFIAVATVLLVLYNPLLGLLSGLDGVNIGTDPDNHWKWILRLSVATVLCVVTILHILKKINIKHLIVLLLIFNLSSLIGFGLNAFSWQTLESQRRYQADDSIAFKKKPNIYFLVMDMYPGGEKLRIMNFKNRLFYNQLENKGFFIHHKFRSNYPTTLPSFHSMFNMELNENQFSYDALSTFADSLAGDNRWNANLQNNDYHTVRISELSDFYRGHGCFYNECYSPGISTIIGFLHTIKLAVIFPHIPILDSLYGQLLKIVNYKMLDQTLLKIDQASKRNQPTFLYTHYEITHVGYIHGYHPWYEECIKSDYQGDYYKYFSSVECANDFYIKMVNRIQQKDPTAIIILSSDHGQFVRDPSVFSVLYASKLPKKCEWINDKLKSNINVFNYLQACLSKTEPKNIQPDNSYYVEENAEYTPAIINEKIL
jgi:hypothetical protein